MDDDTVIEINISGKLIKINFPPIIKFPVPLPVDSENVFTPADRTVYLLGGGGAKGCFQAGAIGFLTATNRDEYKPNFICGTSVGSLNAILTTESAILDDVPAF